MKHVAKQVARFTKALQAYELPSGITGYGSITFDDGGNLSATKSVFQYEGPFSTYREYLKAVIEWQLAHSEDVNERRCQGLEGLAWDCASSGSTRVLIGSLPMTWIVLLRRFRNIV